MNTLEAFNRLSFLAINGTMATPLPFIHAAVIIANYFILVLPLLLVAMWLSGETRERELALRACLIAFASLGVNQVIGVVWPHPRPFMIGVGHTFLAHAADSSFPSDHATLFSAVTLTLLMGKRWAVGTLILLCGIMVSWARVFLGVHFPLDIVGAVVVAVSVYVVSAPLWKLGGEPTSRAIIFVYRKVLARPIAVGWLRP